MKRIDYWIFVAYLNKILHKRLFISTINFLSLKKTEKKDS